MKIEVSTQLMPNHLPGGAVPAFARVEMMPTPDGRVVLFAIDTDNRLAVWLSSAQGYTRWVQVPFELADGRRPQALDLDVVGSPDGETFDLAVVTTYAGGSGVLPENVLYAFHAVPASADPEAWVLRFAEAAAVPLPLSPVGARWGRTGGPARPLATWGPASDGRVEVSWLEFGDDGRVTATRAIEVPDGVLSSNDLSVMTASQRVDGALVDGCFLVSPAPDRERRLVRYVTPANDDKPERVWPQRFTDGSLDGWGPLSDMVGAQWPESDVTIAFFNVLTGSGEESVVCFLNDTAAIAGEPAVVAKSSLVDYRLVAGPVHVDIEITESRHVDHRFELVAPRSDGAGESLLRMTVGSESSTAASRSTLLAADVEAFCACRCVDPATLRVTRHVLVGYRQGGVELFTLDPVSGLWQRYVLADDRLDAVHDVSSYTLRVQPLENDAPLSGGVLSISSATPSYASVQGRALHLSPLVPTVFALAGGEAGIVLSQGSLAAPVLTLDVYDDVVVEPSLSLPLLPPSVLDGHVPALSTEVRASDVPMDKLGAIPDGTAIRNAVASDGSQPFKDRSQETCDAAYAGVRTLVAGYRAVGEPASAVARSRDVVRRLRFEGAPGQVRCTVVPLDSQGRAETPPTIPSSPNDVIDDFGNLLAYLWTEVGGDLVYYLEELADGLLQLVVEVGGDMVSLEAQTAEAVAECTDWFLQHTLGITLDDIVNWLGFVFDWDSILRNKDALTRVAALAQDYCLSQLTNAESAVTDAAAYLRTQLASLSELSPEVRDMLSQQAQSRPAGDSALTRAGGDASAQWGVQTLRSYGGASQVDATDNAFAFITAIEQTFLDQGLVLETLADEVVAYLGSADLAGRSLVQIFEDVLALLAGTVITAGETMALDVLTVLETLFGALDSVLDERIDVPVLTTLYETVLVPGGTLSMRDAMMLAASIVSTVGHKIAYDTDLFGPEELAAIDAADSLPALVEALEGPSAVAGGRVAVGGIIGLVSSTSKLGYVLFWTIDAWYPYAPGEPKLKAVNLAKVAFDGLSWGLSLSWAMYRATLTYTDEPARVAAEANLMAVGTTTFNRAKDAIETSAMLKGESVPKLTTSRLRVGEAVVAGGGLLLCDLLFTVALAKVPIHNCPEERWWPMVVMPAVHLADSGVYSLLALEGLVENEATRYRLRALRTGVNWLRPVLGYVTAGLKIDAAGSGYDYPGSAAD